MQDPGLGLGSRGLVQPSGLGLATRGLLLDVEEVVRPAASGSLPPAADARLVFDVEALAADLRVAGGQLEAETGLQTAVVISLFSDRRAREDDPLPAGETTLRRWWGDYAPPAPGDRIGSLLWLLSREKTIESVRARAAEYAREALAWLIEDEIANRIDVEAEIEKLPGAVVPSILALGISIWRPPEREIAFRFRYVWRAA